MLSAPHFYYCPPSVLDAVEGLHPVKEWHETHFDIEPVRDSRVPIMHCPVNNPLVNERLSASVGINAETVGAVRCC